MPDEGSNQGDYAWAEDTLGPTLASWLWPHLQMAEAARLRRAHGYPKDNALPEPLRLRLGDPRFEADVRQSILDDEALDDELDDEAPHGEALADEVPDTEALLEGLRRLAAAARNPTQAIDIKQDS